MLNSQVSGVAIQLRLRYSVTEALRIAKADYKSSVLILLDLSAAFNTVNHQILLSTLSSLDITGIPPRLFESYLTGRSFRVAWGGEAFLHIHYITGSHHTGTWLLLTLLRWWNTSLSLISTRWCNGSCTVLRLPGRHHGMDERTSPTDQSGKDWASCLSCHSNSTAWLHDSVRFINNYPISFGQKSWCNLWPADLQRANCKDYVILQVCTSQHQKDQALSDRACCTTSCPGPCHF